MAWTTPKSWTTGYKVLASDMNTFLSDNDAALRGGGIAIASQAAQEVIFASSSTALSRSTGLTFNDTTDTLTAGALSLGIGQITFPTTQVPSADANTLDDYEEGSWTPVLGGAGGTSGQGYTDFREGRYVKIGKVVTIQFHFKLTTEGTITGDCQIQGLPFTSRTVGGAGAEVCVSDLEWTGTATSFVAIKSQVKSNATVAGITGLTAAATGGTALTASNVQNNTVLAGVYVYETSA